MYAGLPDVAPTHATLDIVMLFTLIFVGIRASCLITKYIIPQHVAVYIAVPLFISDRLTAFT